MSFGREMRRTGLSRSHWRSSHAQVNALLNAASKDGWTPLMGAADKGRTDIARVLLDTGAKPGAVNHEKRSAMTYAEKGKHDDIVALLKNSGAK